MNRGSGETVNVDLFRFTSSPFLRVMSPTC